MTHVIFPAHRKLSFFQQKMGTEESPVHVRDPFQTGIAPLAVFFSRAHRAMGIYGLVVREPLKTMKSIALLKVAHLLSSGHRGRSLTVTLTECLRVSTPRAGRPGWASGNTAVTITSGVNAIQIYVAATLQKATEHESQTGYTRNGCASHQLLPD